MSDSKKAAKKPAKKKDSLVKMVRDDGLKADVHPEMVEEYKRGGYKLAD